MNLIKVLNPNKAKELATLGFEYTTEKIGDKTIFVFIQSNKLMNDIIKNFSKHDFFIDRTMNF